MKNTFGRPGAGAPIVDKLIGTAYPIVRFVAENMATVKHVSYYMSQLYDIAENIENLQNFLIALPIVEDLLNAVPMMTVVHDNLPLIISVNDNMAAILHVHQNVDALLQAEISIRDDVETIQEFIVQFGDLDTAIAAVNQIKTDMEGIQEDTEQIKVAAETARDLARDWASKSPAPVEGGEYSAKVYADRADASAALSEEWANAAPDTPVGDDEGFSARHWAKIAEDATQFNNVSLMHFAGDGTSNPLALAFPPGTVNNIEVNIKGFGTQPRGLFTVVGNLLYPPAGAVWPVFDPESSEDQTWNIEVVFASAIEVGVPADGTITNPKVGNNAINARTIDGADAEAIKTKLGLSGSTAFKGFVLSNPAGDPVNDITIGPGRAFTSDDVLISLTGSLTKQSDAPWAAGNNAGLMDTGAVNAGAYTYLHLYAIRNPTTNARDVIASLSAVAPAMPAGYTQAVYLWPLVRRSTAAGGMIRFIHQGNKFHLTNIFQSGNVAIATTRSLYWLNDVPTGVRVEVDIMASIYNASPNLHAWFTHGDAEDQSVGAGTRSSLVTIGTSGYVSGQFRLLTNLSGQIAHKANLAIGNCQFLTIGWEFTRP